MTTPDLRALAKEVASEVAKRLEWLPLHAQTRIAQCAERALAKLQQQHEAERKAVDALKPRSDMVCVPRESTEAMQIAGELAAGDTFARGFIVGIYKAMLAAYEEKI